MQISRVHMSLQNSCLRVLLPALSATTREDCIIAVQRSKSKGIAVPKGSCENRMSGELTANRSPLQNRTSACSAMPFGKQCASCEFQKETGTTNCLQPGAVNCIRWTATSVKREVVS